MRTVKGIAALIQRIYFSLALLLLEVGPTEACFWRTQLANVMDAIQWYAYIELRKREDDTEGHVSGRH